MKNYMPRKQAMHRIPYCISNIHDHANAGVHAIEQQPQFRVPLKEKRLYNQIESDSQAHTDASDSPPKKTKVLDILKAQGMPNPTSTTTVSEPLAKMQTRLSALYFENNFESNHANSIMPDCPPIELDCCENLDRSHSRQLSECSLLKSDIDDSSPIDSCTLEQLITQESEYKPDINYFERKQTLLTKYMRAILIDWMMEVCSEYRLKRETFYLSINYVDRYLSTVANVSKSDLQLIGATSMYTAAKFEEIYPPKVMDFVKSTDNGFTPEQIIETEIKICKVLHL